MPATAEYIAEYRRSRRAEAVVFLGGRCAVCGSAEGLEFDHVDPTTKVANIASMLTVSKGQFWAEVQKCQLLCGDCHSVRTRSQSAARIPASKGTHTARHGTAWEYRCGCRCEPCKDAKRASRTDRRVGSDDGESGRAVNPVPLA